MVVTKASPLAPPDVRVPLLGPLALAGSDAQDWQEARDRWSLVARLLAAAVLLPVILAQGVSMGWLGLLWAVWLGLGGYLVLLVVGASAYQEARSIPAWRALKLQRGRLENEAVAGAYQVLLDAYPGAVASAFPAPQPMVLNVVGQSEVLAAVRSDLGELVELLKYDRARVAGEVAGQGERARVAARPVAAGADDGDTQLLDLVMVAGAFDGSPSAQFVDRAVCNQAYGQPSLIEHGIFNLAQYESAVGPLVRAGLLRRLGATCLLGPDLAGFRDRWKTAAGGDREAIEQEARDLVVSRLAGL